MSWVKNLWNRMFPEDTEEEHKEFEPETESSSLARPEKAPFRFPLITDEEKGSFIKHSPGTEKLRDGFNRADEQPVSPRRRPMNPALKRARNYDFDAVQIEEPAEAISRPRERNPVRNREPIRDFGPTRTYEPRRSYEPVRDYEPPTPVVRSYEPPAPPKTRKYEAPKPIKKTRRFEPTRVPSPIHGYNDIPPVQEKKIIEKKTTKFEQLKRDEEEVAAILAASKTPALNFAPEAAEEPKGADAAAPEKEPEVQAVELAEAPVESAEITEMEAEVKEELVSETEAETITAVENKAEAVPNVHKESPAVSEPVSERAKPVEKREKTVPFNVLMLKSDKERVKKVPAAPVQVNEMNSSAANRTAEAEKPVIKLEAKEEKKLEISRQLMSEVLAPEGKGEAIETGMPAEEPIKEIAVYQHPSNEFLRPPENDLIDEEWMEEQGERLVEALSHFQIQASILSIVQGPAVTQFELTVAQGVKVSKIRNLADDLKLALAAKDIRIQAPIPGKSSIGIEIPNRKSRPVRISEVIESRVFLESESPMEAALGLDLTGKPVTLDLRKMPHGLIAGATGSGKSVCINSILVSLLYKSSPKDLKLLLIDPKMVELAPYNHIPHLISPVITDVKAATASLKWAVEEMERRYQLFAHAGVRDLNRYNKMVKEKGDHAQHLPYIMIVIDELADLMMMSPSDVEDAICRIAQKARACGIHLVIATQRPSVDVITGLIKSNIPTRIAFSVSSQVDSRTILDTQGAERLLGRGDMLYLGNGMSAPVRIQGTFVTDDEIEDVIAHVRSQGEPEYFFKEEELMKRSGAAGVQDDLFEEACRFIMSQGSASTSLLQRKFHIGYNRAARLMDLIEQHGFISEQNGSKARAVLITEDDMAEVFQ